VAEGYQFKGPFPFDVDHMPGAVHRDGDRTTDNVKSNNKRDWDRAVNSINARVFDDNADYSTTSAGTTVDHNGVVFALWSNKDNAGWFNVKGRKLQPNKLGEQGVAEGSNDTIYPNAEVIKLRNGRPIGEIYQDENGWGFFHYGMDSGNDFIDSREDAIEGLRDLHQETGRSRPDYTIKGVAEAGYPEVDHMPGPTIKRTQTGCKRCHGKGYVYKTDDGEVHPMNRPDAKKYKCGKCSGIGFVKSDVVEEKIKGADGKACWPGYRYNGTENGKDDCVKVKESSILEGLQQVDEINWKHAAAAGAMALGALGGAGQAQAQFNPSGLSDVYLQQVVSGEHQRPMVSIDAAKAELQARMNGKQQKVSPQSDSGSNKPFTPVDYQTKEPLKKGADGKWYNSNGEERDGLHGGPISAQGTAMHRGLKLRQ
jgi:hypothetical protein